MLNFIWIFNISDTRTKLGENIIHCDGKKRRDAAIWTPIESE